MAERRMFTKKVTDDDNFMALSSSAQALYLHLSMSADDDGFNNQITICMFKAHASLDDLQSLLEKRYIYQFENGVIVIKHWRMANALRKDRYNPTTFQEELKKLRLKKNGSYTFANDQIDSEKDFGCHLVATGKDRLDKDRIDKDRLDIYKTIVSEADEKISSGRSKSKLKTDFAAISFPDNQNLQDAWNAFEEMRKKLKKPLTDRARTLALKKLSDLSGNDDQLALRIIDQSVLNSWQSFYQIKSDNKKSGGIDWDNV